MSQHLEKRRRKFAELLDAHGSPLLGMLRRLARNSHDADEVFQETALRVWKNIAQLPRIRNPRGWLMTIGYRAFLDYQKRQTKNGPLTECPDEGQASPRQQAEYREMAHQLQSVVADLPEAMREVVVLHYTGGLSLRETAAAMGLPVGTAKSRLNQALAILRKKMR